MKKVVLACGHCAVLVFVSSCNAHLITKLNPNSVYSRTEPTFVYSKNMRCLNCA